MTLLQTDKGDHNLRIMLLLGLDFTFSLCLYGIFSLSSSLLLQLLCYITHTHTVLLDPYSLRNVFMNGVHEFSLRPGSSVLDLHWLASISQPNHSQRYRHQHTNGWCDKPVSDLRIVILRIVSLQVGQQGNGLPSRYYMLPGSTQPQRSTTGTILFFHSVLSLFVHLQGPLVFTC
jgi:hypothetical protein